MCSIQHHHATSRQFMMLAKPGQRSKMIFSPMQVILTPIGQGSTHHVQHSNALNDWVTTFYRYFMSTCRTFHNVISFTLLRHISLAVQPSVQYATNQICGRVEQCQIVMNESRNVYSDL